MAQYATATELAGYLQTDVDTYTANQVLTLASAIFSRAAGGVPFDAPTSVTWTARGTLHRMIQIPYRPITAVTAVRINGTAVTGWKLIRSDLYRPGGFGTGSWNPPDLLEVDLTYGYSAVPDDVKGAVLETAGGAYARPRSGVDGETIDDYQVRYTATQGMQLGPLAEVLAAQYRGTLAV